MFGIKQKPRLEAGRQQRLPEKALTGEDALWKKVRIVRLHLQELEERVETLERARKREQVLTSKNNAATRDAGRDGDKGDPFMAAYKAMGGK